MLPYSFDNYFINLTQVHVYNTRQKLQNEFYQSYVGLDLEKKTLQCVCLSIRKIFRKNIAIVYLQNSKNIL